MNSDPNRNGAPARSHFVTAMDGLRLHAREWGEPSRARALVCLPGLARTAEDFDALARAVASGQAGPSRRVVAIDYRGRGLSERDRNWRNYDMRVENADILAVLTAFEIGEAAFLGTSRGGLHIMMLAATRPAAIGCAILNDIGPVIELRGLARIRRYVGKLPTPTSWSDAVDLCRKVMSAQFTALSDHEWETYARLTFSEENGAFVPRYDPRLANVLGEIDLGAPLPTLWPQFEGLRRRPLMILRGEHSDLLSPDTFVAMGERHPDCRSLTVAGQGHAPLLMDAPTIARICDFLAEGD